MLVAFITNPQIMKVSEDTAIPFPRDKGEMEC